jgi:FtsP/CotA-like multicopper oxidase with cupredoxin domain
MALAMYPAVRRLPRYALLLLASLACRATSRAPELAVSSDNRTPAGSLHGAELTLDLEVRSVRWRPAGDGGYTLRTVAFAERGKPATIPGPLIRVPAGTVIRARLTNTLPDSTIVVHGMQSRPGVEEPGLALRPGESRELRFAAGEPGTYFYWGGRPGNSLEDRIWFDEELSGGFIVDPPGKIPDDRVFVIGMWSKFADSTRPGDADTAEVFLVNGRTWPHAPIIRVPVGDTVRWRWINASSSSHPMHLHGVYFEVASRGDARRDSLYDPGRRPREVTELMFPGGTMLMRWAPARPGNWLFHCHFAFHVSPEATAGLSPHGDQLPHMAGLALGIEATGGSVAPPPAAPRRLRLLVQEQANRVRGGPGYGFVLDQGEGIAPDSVEIPGPPLVLTRGQPVAITVVNHLHQPTAVHWHGMELESYFDGVPDVSGAPPAVFRPIAPGDSFVARFTPPRAGTFIYHTHFQELDQMVRGLYGALLVLEPGQRYDPAVDHLVIVGGNGPVVGLDSIHSMINGAERPAAIRLAGGRIHRLRIISIDVDRRIRFSLWRDSTLATWRAVAKDGADLAPALAGDRAATLLTGPGETADFLVTPGRDDRLTLRIEAPFIDVPWSTTLPLEIE